MYIDQTVCQMKSDAYTAVWEAALHKAFEQFGTLLFRDAQSCVDHLYAELFLLFLYVYFEYNLSVGRSIFKSVGEQVIDHFIKIPLIHRHLVRVLWGLETEIHVFGFADILETKEYFIAESDNIRFLQGEGEFVFLHFPEFQ